MKKTIKEFYTEYLQEKGLWPEDVNKILNLVKQDEILKAVPWEDAFEYYLPITISSITYSLNKFVLGYIDEHKPSVFYRRNFLD